MKALKITFLLFCVSLCVGCDDESNTNTNINSSLESKLKGTWVNPVFEYPYCTYERALALKENDYGFTFDSDKKFTERKNSSWCGTPPVDYVNYNGSWTANTNKSIINIKVGYWGGEESYEWKVISIDDKNLTIEVIK